MAETLYEVLGLKPNATLEEIKAAYRREVMRWHPDRNGGSEMATHRFRQILEAHKTLTDIQARQRYDENLARGNSQAMLSTSSFWNNTMELAFFLAERGVSPVVLAQELSRRGCPPAIAAAIAQAIAAHSHRSRLSRLSKLARATRRPFAAAGKHTLDLGLLIKRAVFLMLLAVLAAAWFCDPRSTGKLQQAMLSDQEELATHIQGNR
ncbi:J domain-containing protein [Thermithiobacillus plumbiphilus]|uniref:J domain-containing protein n=1 Tax=Thermithiobacillus plumbiphilus TaxID=1729899 RepID=A0ABU9DA04_9PROT